MVPVSASVVPSEISSQIGHLREEIANAPRYSHTGEEEIDTKSEDDQIQRAIDRTLEKVQQREEILRQRTEKKVRTLHDVVWEIVHCTAFHIGISCLISVNAVYIGVATDSPELEEGWSEIAFTAIFALEQVLRIYADRAKVLRDAWAVFDLLLVLISVADLAVARVVFSGSGSSVAGSVATSMRVIRILRITRILRLVRLLRVFKELWLLVSGIISAMRAIMWAWTLLLLVIYVFAIVGTRLMHEAWKGVPSGAKVEGMVADLDVATVEEFVDDYFGSVAESMFTFFQVMTTEGWAEIGRTVLELNPMFFCIILLFMTVTTFAIMNVVVAVIVQNTLDHAFTRRDSVMKKIRKEQKKAMGKAYEIFCVADTDGNGSLTRKEFLDAIELPEVKMYLHEVGVDTADASDLFDILDFDESEALAPSEFVEGCIRARGDARAKEMMMLRFDVWKFYRRIHNDFRDLAKVKAAKRQGAVAAVDREQVDQSFAVVDAAVAELRAGVGARLAELEREVDLAVGGTSQYRNASPVSPSVDELIKEYEAEGG